MPAQGLPTTQSVGTRLPTQSVGTRFRVPLLAGLLLAFSAARALAAEAPEIVAELGAEEIFIGETVDFVVEIRNVENPVPPDLSELRDDFGVAANGDESRNQMTVTNFNGRVTRKNVFSHVYRYRLTPKRTGHLTVSAPATTVEGKTILGRALALNVVAPEAQEIGRASCRERV